MKLSKQPTQAPPTKHAQHAKSDGPPPGTEDWEWNIKENPKDSWQLLAKIFAEFLAKISIESLAGDLAQIRPRDWSRFPPRSQQRSPPQHLYIEVVLAGKAQLGKRLLSGVRKWSWESWKRVREISEKGSVRFPWDFRENSVILF